MSYSWATGNLRAEPSGPYGHTKGVEAVQHAERGISLDLLGLERSCPQHGTYGAYRKRIGSINALFPKVERYQRD
jgi:hypothetical protein